MLTAGESNAGSVMPVTLMTQRVIETATDHANILGIGYATLAPRGMAWVLLRVSIAMKRWPGINEHYSLTTWIEDWNRLYSDRCFEVRDGDGNVIGHVRTLWAAIDVDKRTPVDLSVLDAERFTNTDTSLVCPVPRQRKMLPVADGEIAADYTFAYCDIDFNGHVNSTRYIEHILNLWSPEFFAGHPIASFEIAYLHECHYGEQAHISAALTAGSTPVAAIDVVCEGRRAVSARIAFVAADDPDQ